MSHIGNTYLDIMNQANNYKEPEEVKSKRDFDKKMSAAVDNLINALRTLPEYQDLIASHAGELFAQLPECMKEPDPVTRQEMGRKEIEFMLRGKLGSALKLGFGFFKQ
ncbi:hypothetical protein NAJ88_004394 [Escherichia coli]|nr:hypothetical protein [Escherichia coli]